MGSFSVWHWLVVGLLIAGAWAAIRSLRNAARRELPGPGGLTPYGVGGWLAFFILATFFIGPFFAIGQLAINLGEVERTNPALLSHQPYLDYKTATWLLTGLYFLWCWRMAYALKRHFIPRSATRAKYTLLLGPVLLSVADHGLAYVLMDVTPQGVVVLEVARGMISTFIWFLYFALSVRVLNTYYDGRKELKWSYASEMPARTGSFQPSPVSSPAQTSAQATAWLTETSAAGLGYAPPAADPPMTAALSLEVRLEQLAALRGKGLIGAEDYERKKEELLRQL